MQGFAKKTKKELEGYPLKYFVVEGSTLEDCRKIITTHIQEKTIQNDHSQHKGTSSIKIIQVCVCQASFGCSYRNECQKSWVGWFLRTGGLT